jgi:prepilin-type N-terminal cleavage/methylation domain-containing protein
MGRQLRGEEGFSMIEVLVAMVILAIVMLGLQATITDRVVRTVGTETRRATANQLAKDRIARIQLDPGYISLETRFSGTESPVAGAPRFTRSTSVVRSAQPLVNGDYKTVTVRVWGGGMPDTVSRTTIISAP